MKHVKGVYARFKNEWINNFESFGAYDSVFETVDGLIEALQSHRANTEKSGQLTKDGITASTRTFAAKSIVPALRREQLKLEAGTDKLNKARANLATVKIDKSDAGAATIRAQIRERIAAMEPAKRKAFLANGADEATMAAIVEAPAWLSGISAEDRAELIEKHLAATQPEALARIKEERDAIAVTGQAITIALYELKKNCAFLGAEHLFDQFMTDATAAAERRPGYAPFARDAA